METVSGRQPAMATRKQVRTPENARFKERECIKSHLRFGSFVSLGVHPPGKNVLRSSKNALTASELHGAVRGKRLRLLI